MFVIRGPIQLPVDTGWPTLLSTGPAAIGITSFTPWTFGASLTPALYGSFPTDGSGNHLVQGYDLSSVAGSLDIDTTSRNWLFLGCKCIADQQAGSQIHLHYDSSVNGRQGHKFRYCEYGSASTPKMGFAPNSAGMNTSVSCDGTDTELGWCQFYHYADCIQEPGSANIHDSFAFNPRDPGSGAGADHTDIVLLNGSDGFILNHNWFENPFGQTTCLNMEIGAGSTHNNPTITNNYVAGGGFSMSLAGVAGWTITGNAKYTGNRFSIKFYPTCGAFGPVKDDPRNAAGGAVFTWLDNRFTSADGLTDGALIP